MREPSLSIARPATPTFGWCTRLMAACPSDSESPETQYLDWSTAWKVLGERMKNRAGMKTTPHQTESSALQSSPSVSPPILSPDEAWHMLGSRKMQRLKRSHGAQDRLSSLPDVQAQSSADGVSDKYLKDIEKMNCLITLSSVAEKAAASWKSRSGSCVQSEAAGRRPSDGLFDFPLTAQKRLEARRPSRVQFDLPSEAAFNVESESSSHHADISESASACSYHGSMCRSSDSSESSKQPRSTPSSSSHESKKSQRARKRGDSLIPSPSCRRQVLRRRRFSKHEAEAARETDCKCRSSRRRSSLIFHPRVPDVLSAGAKILHESASPSADMVRLAARRGSAVALHVLSPPSSPDRAASSPPASSVRARTPRRPSEPSCRRRSLTVSTTCAVSMFAQDLRIISAEIPAGDPRIGELYSAAARAFGPPKFFPAPVTPQQQAAEDFDDHPNEQTE